MTELVNTHCHTGYCGHAEGDVDEYACIAHDAGLTTLAFTDHYPLTPAFDPDDYLSVLRPDLPAYKSDVLAAREKYPDMEVLLGCELDYLGTYEDREGLEAELEDFDIVLGSVHFVDAWPFDDPAKADRWEEPGAVEDIWRRYVDLWCEAASDKTYRFEVMSHPDLAKKFAHYPSFDLAPYYKRMADAANAGGRVIELNTSGSYYKCKDMFPSVELLEEFNHAEVPATLGTDAHVPENVTRDIEKGYDRLRRAGYSHLTVPTRNRGRREVAL